MWRVTGQANAHNNNRTTKEMLMNTGNMLIGTPSPTNPAAVTISPSVTADRAVDPVSGVGKMTGPRFSCGKSPSSGTGLSGIKPYFSSALREALFGIPVRRVFRSTHELFRNPASPSSFTPAAAGCSSC